VRFTRAPKTTEHRRAVLVWLSLFAVAPIFSVLDLEVFRWSAPGRQSEDHLPAPPVPSGATPEYDHSRQSIDSAARPGAPTSPFGRERTHGRAAACIELGHRRRANGTRLRPRGPKLSLQHPTTRGGDLRRDRHRPRTDGRRSRDEPRGPVPDRPERNTHDRSRERSLPNPLGSEWQATADLCPAP
jgi:hypothetical protein